MIPPTKPILAGPIIRRVSPERVTIWVALDKPYRVETKIYHLQKYKAALRVPEVPELLGSGIVEKPTRLGENLYISLINIHPSEISEKKKNQSKKKLFPYDEILVYDIELQSADGTMLNNLASLKLVDGENAITYRNRGLSKEDQDEDAPLPSFFISQSNLRFNFVHASCRKLHGEGGDAMRSIDSIIKTNVTKTLSRPSNLFLTGDQIYADDVSQFLIKHLTTLGNFLLGWVEKISGVPEIDRIGVGNRKLVAKQILGFSSGEAGNHLLSFGEFVSMYLVAWNIEIWPELPHSTHPIRGSPPGGGATRQETDYQMELYNLKQAKDTMHAVRRVLANVPTYMIFDDHEITDDWNLTQSSYMKIFGNPAAMRVILNGLTAYWFFQGWGNDPDKYSETFKLKLEGYIKELALGTLDEKREQELFLELNPCMFAEKSGGKPDQWSFVTATNPPVLFLDTRTQRQYDSSRGAARLLSEALLNWVTNRLSQMSLISKELIIVAPAPVIGFEFEESLREWASENVTSPYSTDLEAWSSNAEGYFQFFKKIIEQVIPQPDCFIFLSGDVHYANTAFSTISMLKNGSKYRIMHFYQLTSSAIKNTDFMHQELVGRTRFTQARRGVKDTDTFLDTELLGYEFPLLDPVLRELLQESKIAKVAKQILPSTLADKNHRAIILRSDHPKLSKVKAKPSWTEFRRYYAAGSSGSPIVGHNNIGLVNLTLKGKRALSHNLHVPDKNTSYQIKLDLPFPI